MDNENWRDGGQGWTLEGGIVGRIWGRLAGRCLTPAAAGRMGVGNDGGGVQMGHALGRPGGVKLSWQNLRAGVRVEDHGPEERCTALRWGSQPYCRLFPSRHVQPAAAAAPAAPAAAAPATAVAAAPAAAPAVATTGPTAYGRQPVSSPWKRWAALTLPLRSMPWRPPFPALSPRGMPV